MASADAKRVILKDRYKLLDESILKTFAWARKNGRRIESEQHAYNLWKRYMVEDKGFPTYPQNVAKIDPNTVEDAYGFEVFRQRLMHLKTTQVINGNVVRMRRILDFGIDGTPDWQDFKLLMAEAETEPELEELSRRFLAAAQRRIDHSEKGCETVRLEATGLQQMAEEKQRQFQPRLMAAADVREITTVEVEEIDDGDAE